MNQMLELTDKDFEVTTVILYFFIAWNMFSMHENLSRETRYLSQATETIKKNQMGKGQKFADMRCSDQAK